MESALANRVAAGQALAVDRAGFAAYVTERLERAPEVEVVREETSSIPEGHVVVATGPLTSDRLSSALSLFTGSESLYFYDAMAPIVDGDSIDRSVAFDASRYGKGGDDYLNCPMSRDSSSGSTRRSSPPTSSDAGFRRGTRLPGLSADRDSRREGSEDPALRAHEAVGLEDPRTGRQAWAVVQLRREDEQGQRWNLVGFQTKAHVPGQERVFRLIPGSRTSGFTGWEASTANTYVDAPRLLDSYLRFEGALGAAGRPDRGRRGYLEAQPWVCGPG